MSKGAIVRLTRILAKGLGGGGSTSTRAPPGPTETESYRIGKDPEFVVSLQRMSAFNRVGRVDDIADVAFVAGDGARSITRQNIRVNGGTV
jgi:3-oxoacyl-[acyl-carrier protein] reductase